MTHDLWARLNEQMLHFLGSVNLQTLVDEQRDKNRQRGTPVVTLHDRRDTALQGSV